MLSKIKHIIGNITVEPINVLFLLGILSIESVRQNFFLKIICKNEFPNNTVCDFPSNYNTTVKDIVSTKTSSYITIW